MLRRVGGVFIVCSTVVTLLAGSAVTASAAQNGKKNEPVVDIKHALSTAGVFASVSIPTPTAEMPSPAQVGPIRRAEPGVLADAGLRRGLIASFGALQVLDAHSTSKALNNGAREANPVMAGIGSNKAVLYAVKGVSFAATAYFTERLGKKHPKKAVLLMVALNSAYAGIVAHNYRIAARR